MDLHQDASNFDDARRDTAEVKQEQAHALSSHVPEEYRTLLGRLGWNSSKRSLARIGLTSCVRHEGVTTVALQLAIAAADQGRVLLVDANFDHGALHEVLRVDNRHGLGELLQNHNSYDTIFETCIHNMFVIPCGKQTIPVVARNELLLLLDSLRTQFDLVIFDFPALQERFHSIQWLAMCQPLLLVAATSTPESELRRGQLFLGSSNLSPLGVVRNQLC